VTFCFSLVESEWLQNTNDNIKGTNVKQVYKHCPLTIGQQPQPCKFCRHQIILSLHLSDNFMDNISKRTLKYHGSFIIEFHRPKIPSSLFYEFNLMSFMNYVMSSLETTNQVLHKKQINRG
jgi:hypothetical protein